MLLRRKVFSNSGPITRGAYDSCFAPRNQTDIRATQWGLHGGYHRLVRRGGRIAGLSSRRAYPQRFIAQFDLEFVLALILPADFCGMSTAPDLPDRARSAITRD